MAAKETKRLQIPAAGSCFAEEGQSWDPPVLSLNTFHDGEAIAAAKSTGPMLHKHHGADGPCLKASLPNYPALGSHATIAMAANGPAGQ